MNDLASRYLEFICEDSLKLKVLVRLVMDSGDVLEGRFVEAIPNSNMGNMAASMFEFKLQKGGTTYVKRESIESITLLDNLQILEQKDYDRAKRAVQKRTNKRRHSK